MILLAALLACSGPSTDDSAEEPWDRGENPHALDHVLRLNHIQTKGTHNSYHQEPDSPIDDSHRYSHPTLTEQVRDYGVRQLELDLHLTEDGEWEVFHLPGVDAETSCLRFEDCLQELKDWSDANGWHLPVVIWIEPKDEIDAIAEGYEPIGDDLLRVDAAITEVWPTDRLFTPDDLRGEHADLPTALAADGWPLLEEVRGKLIFALLDTGDERDLYTADAPALEGRVLFADTSEATDPFAAFVKDGSTDDMIRWGEQGFIITDNGSSANDDDASAQATDEAALAAGVHHLATDLAAPRDGYWLDLQPQCNPRTAPSECLDEEVEKL